VSLSASRPHRPQPRTLPRHSAPSSHTEAMQLLLARPIDRQREEEEEEEEEEVVVVVLVGTSLTRTEAVTMLLVEGGESTRAACSTRAT